MCDTCPEIVGILHSAARAQVSHNPKQKASFAERDLRRWIQCGLDFRHCTAAAQIVRVHAAVIRPCKHDDRLAVRTLGTRFKRVPTLARLARYIHSDVASDDAARQTQVLPYRLISNAPGTEAKTAIGGMSVVQDCSHDRLNELAFRSRCLRLRLAQANCAGCRNQPDTSCRPLAHHLVGQM